MISIIICSRNAETLESVSNSIADTISVPFEIIAIDNSKNKYGICNAYNEGASKSKYDLLCFAHEDIAFKTKGWGEIVTNIFQDQTIGVLGVAGGTYQPKAPAGWVTNYFIHMNIIHSVKGKESSLDLINPTNAILKDVAAVDGVWICARKSVWEESPFDSVTFPGFHFYDIDFCTRIFPKHRICVTFEILIEHFSLGSFDDTWYKTALEFYKKRRAFLPFGVEELSDERKEEINLNSLIFFTCNFIDRRISKIDSFYLVNECLARSAYKRDSWWLIRKFIAESLLVS